MIELPEVGSKWTGINGKEVWTLEVTKVTNDTIWYSWQYPHGVYLDGTASTDRERWGHMFTWSRMKRFENGIERAQSKIRKR